MKVIVVGLGSMGKRRIRLIRRFDSEIEIIGVDSNDERAKQVLEEYGIKTEHSLEHALKNGDIECGFVCTSPLVHSTIIKEMLKKNLNVFTEINLVDDCYDEIIQLSEEFNNVLFLSSTFLYRNDVQYIINRTDGEKVNYIYHTGQYLPDWHPWEKVGDFFVSDKRTNGCREILAIEMPWMIKCFGNINKINVMSDELSSLKLGYSDNYVLQIMHENGTKGMVMVDVVSRMPRRSLEIYNEKLQLFWDGTPNSLREYNIEKSLLENVDTYISYENDNRYAENIIEDAYLEEIKAFFDEVKFNDNSKTRYSFKEDKLILKVIDDIESLNVK